jgi:hypothetical protein
MCIDLHINCTRIRERDTPDAHDSIPANLPGG